MLVFSVTHMLKFNRETSSVELAGELALILFSGFMIYCGMYFLRGLL